MESTPTTDELLTALQIADLLWPRHPGAPALSERQTHNRGRQARCWLARRKPHPIVAVADQVGPGRALLYPGRLVRDALTNAPGKGNRTTGPHRRAAARAGHITRWERRSTTSAFVWNRVPGRRMS